MMGPQQALMIAPERCASAPPDQPEWPAECRVDRERRRAVGVEAERMLRRRSSKSGILDDSDDEDTLPRISCDELVSGELIGTGAFNNVYKIHLALPDGGGLDTAEATEKCISVVDTASTVSEEGNRSNTHGQYAYRGIGKSKPGGYVVKHLRPSVMKDLELFRTGAIDLAYEAKLLASLSHENIIQIRGVSAGSLAEAFTSDAKRGYFIILDQVQCTLDDQIGFWQARRKMGQKCRDRQGSTKGTGGSACGGGGHTLVRRMSNLARRITKDNTTIDPDEEQRQLRVRLKVALGLARGLEYLHKHTIIYRDLKPANIGIAYDGKAKILDFGIAREIDPDDADEKLTGMTGTLRYMAPEVALCDHYGLSADVHSFGMMLYEICALQKPFAKINGVEDFKRRVIMGGDRPKPKRWWPDIIKMLIVDCWTVEPKLRPRIDHVALLTHAYIEDIDNDDDNGGGGDNEGGHVKKKDYLRRRRPQRKLKQGKVCRCDG